MKNQRMKRNKTVFLLFMITISACDQIFMNKVERMSSCSNPVADKFKGNPLVTIQKFSEGFMPDSNTQDGLDKINNIHDSIIVAFKALRSDTVNQELYLTLLFLKVYRGHMQCCHQGFELRKELNIIGIDSTTDPLVYEYNLITKFYDTTKRIEMVGSGIAYSWIEKHKNLLQDKRILKEFHAIKVIEDSIMIGIHN